MIITIDGAVGTGKSTIAKHLAADIGYIYFDTGAMYRCLTFAILKHHIDINNETALSQFLNQFKFDIKVKRGERFYYVDGEDVSLQIRGQAINAAVSAISAIPAVREKLVAIQKTWAIGVNAVFEGRDMGTVVFPNAELKIFLTGRPEVRAARRLAELKAKFPEEAAHLTLEEVLKEIEARDTSDSTRATSPLKQASGAFVITLQTSQLTKS